MRGRLTKYEGRRGATWGFVVDVGRDPASGRRRQKSQGGFRTRRLAERALNEICGIPTGPCFVFRNAR